MLVLKAVTFSSLCAFGIGQLKLEQPEISVSREKTAYITCKVFSADFQNIYIHWYRQKSYQIIERLLYVQSTTIPAQKQVGAKIKLEAKGSLEDFLPKTTVFLPSISEINLHKVGTYLCLLEGVSFDVKIDWKEKNGNTILESQEGNNTKTDDIYMKVSWLTVPETSKDKDHVCIIKHKFNKGDQEILFPSIMKVKERALNTNPDPSPVPGTVSPRGKDSDEYSTPIVIKDEGGPLQLQLQLTHTSAYYTYILLFLKSTIYFTIITFSLFWRTRVCGNGKNP